MSTVNAVIVGIAVAYLVSTVTLTAVINAYRPATDRPHRRGH